MAYSVVGQRLPRVDGKAKATGKAQYVVDMRVPRMLFGKILRSPHPHAKILNIDTSKAKRLPGVESIITGKDTLGVKCGRDRVPHPGFRGETPLDQYPLAMDKARYIGDEVAAVAAIDEHTAEESLELIKVDYEVLPAVFDPLEAMEEGSPLVHDGCDRNIGTEYHLEFGDVEKGFGEADYVREDKFVSHVIQHAQLEPHACLSSFDISGRLTHWTSTQSPMTVRLILSLLLGLREGDIRVIGPYVGGGFGGRHDLYSYDFCAALLSMKAGRPVKIALTRHEEFTATRRRPAMLMEIKTGVKQDGTIVARAFRNIFEAGGYNCAAPSGLFRAGWAPIVTYRIPNYRYEGYSVYTNRVPNETMRGHGFDAPVFAFESQLEIIAEEIGIDPVEIRLRNVPQAGDQVPHVARIGSCGLSECIQKAAEASSWREKRSKLPRGRGVGMACYGFTAGALANFYGTNHPYSEAMVKVNNDGTIDLLTMAIDIGQGSDTVLSQIVAEELAVPLKDVRITTADTQFTPVDWGTYASRVTIIAGSAVRDAAADAKRQLFGAAAARLNLDINEELEFKGGRIYVREFPERGITLAEAAVAAQKASGMPVIGRGVFSRTGKNPAGRSTMSISFGAQVVEVEVDEETGQVKLHKVTAAHDCGKAINPLSVEGQLQGAVHMGLGGAVSEQLLFAEGQVLNPTFADYKLLSAADMPEVETIIVEAFTPEGPYGSKEAGEGVPVAMAPAVANAVYDAIGVRIENLPVTPEKILRALAKKVKQSAGQVSPNALGSMHGYKSWEANKRSSKM